MSYSFWSNFTHIFEWFSFFVATWSTISLFILIEKRSRKEIGSYKNFLRIYCLYAFSFALIDWLVQPAIVVDVNGFGYFFYSENRLFDLGYSAAHLIQILYCGCFIASSSFLSLNFIYRYVATCHKNSLNYFQDWSHLIWLLYCATPFSLWSFCVYQWMSPNPERTEQLNSNAIFYENFDLTNRPYVAALCLHVFNTPGHQAGEINWPIFSALLGLCGFQVLFYGISLVCGVLTYKANMSLFKAAQLSKHLYKLQMQLWRAIVLQATVPLLSVYAPSAIVIGGSMAGIYVGKFYGYLAIMCISLYPPLDSLVFLLSIRDYREALFCGTRLESTSSSTLINVANMNRPATARVSDISSRQAASAAEA